MEETKAVEVNRHFLERLLSDMNGKDSEVEVHLRNFRVSVPNTGISLELSGLVTLNVHMRDLTAPEKDALAARRITAAPST
jgi:hypothetical protein